MLVLATDSTEKKRNIGALKNSQTSSKVKRDTSYDDFPDGSEIDTQAYQNTPFNYNDLNELYTFYGMPDISNEKRFLGKWFILLLFIALNKFRCGLYTKHTHIY